MEGGRDRGEIRLGEVKGGGGGGCVCEGGWEGKRHSVLAVSHSVTPLWLYGAFPVMLLPFN